MTKLAVLWRNNLRWRIIALLFVGTVLNYVARNSLGVLAPVLQDKLGITTAQYSYVVGAFQLSYTVMLPVCGILLDRIGLRLGFALFAAIWSLSSMAHAAAVGWLSLALLRLVLGMSEAAVIPAGVKASTEWFPPRERSMAIGWVNVGTALGAVLAVPIVSTVAIWFDWRAAFVATGIMGLVWAAVWFALYRSPHEHRSLTATEAAHIGTRGSAVTEKLTLARVKRLFSSPTFWTIAVPLARPGFLTAAVLGFAHTVGEFGVVLMIGGNIPGQTKVLSVAIYDFVETGRWTEAHILAAGMVLFAFLVILSMFVLEKRAWWAGR